MSKAILRNDQGNPFVYLEGGNGCTAAGLIGSTDVYNIIVSNATTNLDPTSGTPSISINPATNGNITLSPQLSSGETVINNGHLAILGSGSTPGNLLMQNTATGGSTGVISFGGSRFVHNYGINNTFVGGLSGNTNIALSGSGNIGVGASALSAVTSGGSNAMVGLGAGSSLTTGSNNVGLGSSALATATTAQFNTAIGVVSLQAATGAENTGVGYNALGAITSGAVNIALGYNAGSNYTSSESSNIMIGHPGVIAESNTIRIGDGSTQTKFFTTGVNGTSITPAGTVVVSSSGQLGSVSSVPMSWVNTVTNTQQMAVNTGYISNDGATLVTFTLPSTAAIGDSVQVLGKGTGLWTIAQNSGQTIHFGSLNTTTGATGTLSSTLQYDCVRLRCITANTDWIVTGETQGNLTVV